MEEIKKPNILFHDDWERWFDEAELTREERDQMILNIYRQHHGLELEEFTDRTLKSVFKRILEHIQYDEDQWLAKCEAGKRGGRPKKAEVFESEKTAETTEKQKKAEGKQKKAEKSTPKAKKNREKLELFGAFENKNQEKADEKQKKADETYMEYGVLNMDSCSVCMEKDENALESAGADPDALPTHTRVAVHSYFRENGISDPDLFISYNLNKGKDYIFDLESEWQAYAQKWKQAERSSGNGEDWEEVKRKFLAGEYDD